jgi:hypothetical protein
MTAVSSSCCRAAAIVAARAVELAALRTGRGGASFHSKLKSILSPINRNID